MKKPIVIHPFLFAIYPVLFLYAHNVDFVPLSDIFVPTAITIGVAVLLFSLLSLISKDKQRAGLLVSLFVGLFFSYGHFCSALVHFRFAVGAFVIGRHGVLNLAWDILLGLGVFFLVKTRRSLHVATNFLNVVAASLVMLSLINIVSFQVKGSTWLSNRSAEDLEAEPVDLEEINTFPDIYYIILDAYGSANVLQKYWGYDNHEFLDYLRGRGFYIASESKSNYAMSFLSLASSLNMEYINYLSDVLGAESKNRNPPYQMIQDSRAMRFLKSKGYKFIHLRSGWGPTDRNPHADWDIQCGRLNEFMRVLVGTTILASLERDFVASDRRERVTCTFSTLADVQHRIEGPRFVFAHILVPHGPNIFGSNYLEQVMFVNTEVRALVEQILSEAETSPIIVLQADHGPRKKVKRPEERTGILNAYYLPDDGKDLLYDSITPVNTFRLIFNRYFGTIYELLEDKIYFSPLARPYEFTDVTDILTGK